MVVFLLIIIACVLLFGAKETKSTLGALFATFLVLVLLGSCMNMLS